MRGLVLEGGGAKGAFVFGALLGLKEVLKDKGIAIDVVAGTSAGALNGLLWVTGSLAEGEKLWATISPSSSYRPIGGPLSYLTLGLFTFPQLYRQRLESLPAENRTTSRAMRWWLADLLLAVPCFTFLAFLLWFESGDGHRELAVYCVLLGLVATANARSREWCFYLSAIIALLVTLYTAGRAVVQLFTFAASGFPFARTFGHLTGASLASLAAQKLLLWLLFGGSSLLVLLLILLSDYLGITSHDRRPLRGSASELLGRKLNVPLFVTTATEQTVFDPDDFHVRDEGDFGVPVLNHMRRSVYEPHYHELAGELDTAQLDLVMASAALPYGIVTPVVIGQRCHVDGGVADNLPLMPLIDRYPCDEIIVIRTNPTPPLKFTFADGSYKSHWQDITGLLGGANDEELNESYRAYWQQINRQMRVLSWTDRESVPKPIQWRWDMPGEWFENPPGAIPFAQPPLWPKRIITICPPSSLGNFAATMRMEAEFTAPLIEKGRIAAITILNQKFSTDSSS
jgi:predicted patatin/cPLA2 family phospholipase